MRFRSLLSVSAVAALAGILILLALLQYRWIGQASEADRERMRISLDRSVAQFILDLHRELFRATLPFRLDPRAASDLHWERYADRYREWIRGAADTELLENVYLVAFERGGPRLLELDTERGWKPADWPSRLEPLRREWEDPVRRLPFPGRDAPGRGWTVHEQVVAITHPLIEFGPRGGGGGPAAPRVAGVLVLELRTSYIQSVLLPELAQKHFGSGFYDVAVISTGEPRRVLYQSDPAFEPSERVSADARVRLFGTPLERFMSFARRGLDEGGPGQGAGRRPGGLGRSMRLGERGGGLWELVVRHRSGSLDAVVAALRWRNLAVSFGVLLLLAATLAMLVASAQRAQRLAKLQMDFVAGVSHEFRTPLSVICSASDNLAEGVIDPNPRVKQYGALVRDQGRRLRAMVEEILSFAAGEASRRYEIRPVDPQAVIDSTLHDCASMIHESGFSVETRIAPNLPRVMADEAALKQCLQNLVGNAVKYGGEKRWIGISAHAHGDQVRIAVEDKGLGIERSELAHVFEPFYRGRAAQEAQIHGTGLGLSLAKDMMEAMGGRISAKSSLGKGSIFTLHLRAAPKKDGRV